MTTKPQGAAPKQAASKPAIAKPASEAKLSNAELKKQQKAEKAARRVAAKGGAAPAASGPSTGAVGAAGAQTAAPPASGQPPAQTPLQRKPSDSSRNTERLKVPSGGAHPPQGLQVPVRRLSTRRQSISGRNVLVLGSPGVESATLAAPSKNVAFFGHLYEQPRRRTLKGVPKNIHSQVATLGVQMSNYVICGSSSRCLAMLQAFKEIIRTYTTPVGISIARHLVSHHLSPHIDYLKSCRPLSVSMGNVIRKIKDYIVKIDPGVPETEAKEGLIQYIDTLAAVRIVLADEAIRAAALPHIESGDVIVTYAKSSTVVNTLLEAHQNGVSFSVIVIDSRPLFEGRQAYETFTAAGIKTTYALISSASFLVDRATKVFLGAHAIMGNGNLFSRVGTAVVAMLAKRRNIPTVVCCQAIKFTDRVTLDSIVMNEVAPADELFLEPDTSDPNIPHSALAPPTPAKGSSAAAAAAAATPLGASDEAKNWETSDKLIEKWAQTPGLQALNLMYDVTPASFISMIVTEYGVLPPSAVLAVLRNKNIAEHI